MSFVWFVISFHRLIQGRAARRQEEFRFIFDVKTGLMFDFGDPTQSVAWRSF